jgi:hypothetical protein
MIGSKENLKVGSIVRAHDFPPREERGDCFMIGKVTELDGDFFVAKMILRMWDGKEISTQQTNFRTMTQGAMGFDKDYERVTIIA